jgi:hypothetical protein
MSASKTYPLTNPASVAAKIVAEGGPQIDVTKPTGKATASTSIGDVTLAWVISNNSITITVDKKPWELPVSTVWSHLDPLFV